MIDSDSNPSLIKRYEGIAHYGALAVAGLGLAVLAGWKLDIEVLKSVVPGWAAMKPNTAFGFLLAGSALAMVGRSTVGAGLRWVSAIFGAMVAALGLATLGEYAVHFDFGIDQLLFSVPDNLPENAAQSRMSMATASAFTVTGLALICLGQGRTFLVAQAAAMICAQVSILAILGYAYGVSSLYSINAYLSMAPHTAMGFLVLNMGILLTKPRYGLLAVITSTSAGGVMARRLLPLSLVLPFVIGWLLVENSKLDLFSAQFSVAILSFAYLVLFSAVVWRTANVLRLTDLGRWKAEEAEHRNQAQLAGIINSAMDAIIMVDATYHITVFNRAAELMFGREVDDVLGRSLEDLIPPRFRESHREKIRAFGLSGATNQRINGYGNLFGLRANGEEFPIEASVSHLDVEGGKQFTIILRDITERIRGEQALIDSRRQMTVMIEQAPISIAMFDRKMNYMATSHRWLLDYGGGLSSLCGLNHYELNPDISESWKQVHRDGMNGIVTKNDSDLWIKADGSKVWLRWAVHPWITDTGKIGGIIISAEDISNYKLTELALRATENDLNRAQAVGSIGSWRLDLQHGELICSREALRIFGVGEGGNLTYQDFRDRVHPDDRAFVTQMWQAALTGRAYDIEHRLLVDGKIVWVRERAELEFDSNGSLLSAFGITQDITIRRHAQEELKKANNRLAAVAAERAANLRELSSALTLAEQRERDRLYELLHDHVQPILIAARLGLSGLGENSPQNLLLQNVKEAIEQISLVILTLRTLSIELSPPLIRERGLIPALESLAHWIRSKYGLHVEMTHGQDTEPTSLTIRLLCFNAVREALMNVVKYAGTPEVTIDLQREEPDMLRITVCDQGVGFDPASKHVGSGLANFERRFGMVGGSLSLESAPGAGACITLRAPLESLESSVQSPGCNDKAKPTGGDEEPVRKASGAVETRSA